MPNIRSRSLVLILCLLANLAWSKNKSTRKTPTQSPLPEAISGDYLVKLNPGFSSQMAFLALLHSQLNSPTTKYEVLFGPWIRIVSQTPNLDIEAITKDPAVEFAQPNHTLQLIEDYRIQDPLRRAAFLKRLSKLDIPVTAQDNQPIPAASHHPTGIVVGVIDTGVDYTQPLLNPFLWRNNGELGSDSFGQDKATNGVDDDANGFIDDVIGWDFLSSDNLPFDLAVSPRELLLRGGNPGHGTSSAANILNTFGHYQDDTQSPLNIRIMGVRFLSEKGIGTTADAIKAIKYAVDNGATVVNGAWGQVDASSAAMSENMALKDVISYAQNKGALFIAAAGNGDKGKGYNNDLDPQSMIPASYALDNIISVAALDQNGDLAEFSNFGKESVHLAAPGSETSLNFVSSLNESVMASLGGFTIDWESTSVACAKVAGGTASYWSTHPQASWRQVKAAVLQNCKKTASLFGKTACEGSLAFDKLTK